MTQAPSPTPARIRRELKTLRVMIGMFCRRHHGAGRDLCPACQELLDYAEARVRRCRFGAGKPACAGCPVHCFRKDERERIREVMRYAGPRMLARHPVLALWHLLDGRRAPGTPPAS